MLHERGTHGKKQQRRERFSTLSKGSSQLPRRKRGNHDIISTLPIRPSIEKHQAPSTMKINPMPRADAHQRLHLSGSLGLTAHSTSVSPTCEVLSSVYFVINVHQSSSRGSIVISFARWIAILVCESSSQVKPIKAQTCSIVSHYTTRATKWINI